jgi:multidrug efflux pump
MFSHFFIDRPIFAAVISIIISIAGLVAMLALPIAQFPEITPPQITVTANYPGADASTVAQNVGALIENQVNGADDMIYMSSTSSSTGNYSLTVFFNIGTDVDLAQVDVQNRVNATLPLLPQSVTDQGVLVQKKSSTILMLIALYPEAERHSEDFVSNYANVYVLDAIKRIPGANQAAIFGVVDPAMRIWLSPDRMASLGITASDIAQAVSQQNSQFAVGRIGQAPTPEPVQQTFPVTTSGRLTEPAQFENIILRTDAEQASIVRLKDVARADLGRKDYSLRSLYNGKKATMIAIYQQPGANALEVSKQVNETMQALAQSFPAGMKYEIALDTTRFVEASIAEVQHTFFEAVLLVVFVVFLFLQSMRLTIIPALAVPVSILGSFIGMLLLGYSINMLTLFGMILAIGIVVDDAIVVIENTERNMTEFGLSPKEAAKRAMTEVSGPVIAIVLVLCAVFVPVAFLGGITGQLYKQFAVTVAISVVFSGIVALTLSPALAALLLKPHHGEKNRFFRGFDAGFNRLTNGYVRGVSRFIARPSWPVLSFIAICLGAGLLFKMIPSAFVPPEDQGYMFVPYFLPDAASLDRTSAVGARAAEFMQNHAAVANVTQIDGYSLIDGQFKTSAGVLFVSLKDFEQRQSPRSARPCADPVRRRQFRRNQGGLRHTDQPAVDPRSRHHRRLRTVAAAEKRRQLPAAGRDDAGDRRQGPAASGTAWRIGHCERRQPAVAGGGRWRQGGIPGRTDPGCLQQPADPVRFALREPVPQGFPAMAGHPAGRTGIPAEAGGCSAHLRAHPRGEHGAALGCGADALCDRARSGDPLQQLSGGQDLRRGRHRPQLGRGAGGDRGGRPRTHAPRLQL